MSTVKPEALTRVPSAHGGGVVYQIACFPATAETKDFDWRISLAEIDESGAFSHFPGIDRTLIPIDGGALTLIVDGTAHQARQFVGIAFPGDVDTTCTLSGSRARVLNIMARRGVFRARVELMEDDSPVRFHPQAAEVAFIAVLDGSWRTDSSEVSVGPVDVIRIEEPVTLVGAGHLARIVFEACD